MGLALLAHVLAPVQKFAIGVDTAVLAQVLITRRLVIMTVCLQPLKPTTIKVVALYEPKAASALHVLLNLAAGEGALAPGVLARARNLFDDLLQRLVVFHVKAVPYALAADNARVIGHILPRPAFIADGEGAIVLRARHQQRLNTQVFADDALPGVLDRQHQRFAPR